MRSHLDINLYDQKAQMIGGKIQKQRFEIEDSPSSDVVTKWGGVNIRQTNLRSGFGRKSRFP